MPGNSDPYLERINFENGILKVDAALSLRRERGPALVSGAGVRFRSRRSKVIFKITLL